MTKLSDSAWIQIRVKYETSHDSIRKIAKEYGISDFAIRQRIKDEKWQQVLRNTASSLQDKFAIIAKFAGIAETILSLNKDIAVKLHACEDLETQYKGAAAMKFTAKDLMDMMRAPPELPFFNDENDEDDGRVVIEMKNFTVENK